MELRKFPYLEIRANSQKDRKVEPCQIQYGHANSVLNHDGKPETESELLVVVDFESRRKFDYRFYPPENRTRGKVKGKTLNYGTILFYC